MEGKCYADGCDRDARAQGLCLMHYKRLKNRGSLERTKWGKRAVCVHCGKPAVARDLCRSHYYFWSKYGDALYADKNPKADIFVDSKGYLSQRAKPGQKRGTLIHRIVSDAKPGQCVHHINGVKTDNRSDNLHLFDTSTEHLHCHVSLEEAAFELLGRGLIVFDKQAGRYHVSPELARDKSFP